MEMRLTISSPCEYVHKGFASVTKAPGERVYGVVHDVSVFEGLLIDVFEWVPFRFHRRQSDRVVSTSGKVEIDVFFYEAVTPKTGLSTSAGYRDLLVGAAMLYDFPREYVEHLKKLPTATGFLLDHGFCLSNASKRRWMEQRFGDLYSVHDKWREKLCNILP